MPRFSIITVTYNAVATIEETISSVLDQSYKDLEYLIIDGGSTDGTVEKIELASRNDSRIKYISEPDKGIYDAMNKGVRMAVGDYVNFLNAGDRYHDPGVLGDIAGILERPDYVAGVHKRSDDGVVDIIYGDIVYVNPDKSECIRTYSDFCASSLYYLLGDCINHQAMFAARKCFDSELFDISYRISADREWMIRQKKAGRKFKAINRLICYYSLDDNSMSVKNEKLTWQENDRVIRKHIPAGYPIYRFINAVRNGRISSKILHKMYEIVFIRKSN